MKRIILMLLLFVSVTLTYAQNVVYLRGYQYCDKQPGYQWTEWRRVNDIITIDFDRDLIKIDNHLRSCFKVYTNRQYYNSDGEEVIEYKCTDEEYIQCTIRLIIRKSGTRQLYVDYQNITWCWNISV